MAHAGDGCWQILYDEPNVEVVPFGNTTVAVRPFGLVLYAAGSFLHLRVPEGRRPQRWPPSRSALIEYFRGSSAAAGRATWRETPTGWVADHEIEMALDPRLKGARVRYEARIDGDHAQVRLGGAGQGPAEERWRRLSGPGVSFLAGAWEESNDQERWLYLVTAGHFGVMREALQLPIISHRHELSDDDVGSLLDAVGANAGAQVTTPGSFDHWPMIASNFAGYEIRKHQTFRLVETKPDQFRATLPGSPGDDVPSTWSRRTESIPS